MGKASEGFSNRRRSPRASLILPASVVTMSAYLYFDLVNLSATGAKLRGSDVPEIGKTALFRLEPFQALCRVVWVSDELCGVRFEELLPPRLLAHFRKVGNTTQVGCSPLKSNRPRKNGQREHVPKPQPHRVVCPDFSDRYTYRELSQVEY